MCFVSSDITSISEWYLLDQTYWVTNRLELLFVDSTLIVSKRQHDRKVAKNTFLARSTAERRKHRTTSLVSSMIAALWAFTVRLSLSYSEENSYANSGPAWPGWLKHYAEKQTPRMIVTPEREYITRTAGYASYTRTVYDAIIRD